MTTTRLLIVEDETVIANDLSHTLEYLGFPAPTIVASGEAAVQKAREIQPDLILMDIHLKGQLDGLTAGEQIQQHFDIPIIYLTTEADKAALQRVKLTGPSAYLLKPLKECELSTAIEIALYKYQMEGRLRASETRYRLLVEQISNGSASFERLEKAPRQATGRYHQLFEEAPVMYVINRNEEGTPIIIDCNDLLLKTLGYEREEIVGQPVYMFYTPASRTALMEEGGYQRSLEGRFLAEERDLLTRDGRVIETIAWAVPEINSQGVVTGTQGMFIDISDRKKLQRQLEAIYKLGRELTLLRDEASIIGRALETAIDSLDFDLASCGLVDEEVGQLHYRYGLPKPVNLRLSLGGDQGIGVAVVRSGQALNISDSQQDPRYIPLQGRPPNRSILCVPLKIGVRIFGVLAVESVEANSFTAADQRLLQTLADQAAVALENARLYSETRRQARELGIINKATRLMASSLELQTVLQQAIEAINPLLQTEGAAILLLDHTGENLIFECLDGPYPESLLGRRLSISVGVVGWAARMGEAVLVNDAKQDPRFYQEIDKWTGLHTRSLLAVPIIFQEKVIGVLEVINKLEGIFTPHDLETLEALASSAAIAIKNARLYQTAQDQYRRLQQSQAQLIQVEKMAALGRLVASIAHEINNPIQAIQNCLGLTQEELQEQPHQERLQFYTSLAISELDRIAAIVRRMRDFYQPPHRGALSPLEGGSIDDFYRLSPQDLQFVDIEAVLDNVLFLANKQLQQSRVKVKWERNVYLPPVQGSADHLKQVFLNLVLNATDAMAPQGGSLMITTELEQAELHANKLEPVISIKFQDTGLGMSPELLSRMFEPLFTTKEHGSGFGLFTSYKIIEAHQGQITVDSQPNAGTTFTIHLPLLPDSA